MTSILSGVIIGTLILWVLQLIVVMPISSYLTANKLKTPGLSYLNGNNLDDVAKKKLNSIFTDCFIITDVLVLSIAGLLLGTFTGWFFIGFSRRAASWPGMIVFIVTSLIGSFLLYGIS